MTVSCEITLFVTVEIWTLTCYVDAAIRPGIFGRMTMAVGTKVFSATHIKIHKSKRIFSGLSVVSFI